MKSRSRCITKRGIRLCDSESAGSAPGQRRASRTCSLAGCALLASLLSLPACVADNPEYCDRDKPACLEGLICDFDRSTCVQPPETGLQGLQGESVLTPGDASSEATPPRDGDPDGADAADGSEPCDAGDGSCGDAAVDAWDAATQHECSGPAECDDRNPCTTDVCTSRHTCLRTPRTGQTCAVSLPGDGRCVLLAAVPTCLKASGQDCGAPGECADGFCVDGVCCQSACTGVCRSCSLPASPGTCAYVQKGQSTGECTKDHCNSGTCDGHGGCEYVAKGTDCGICAACDGKGRCDYDPAQSTQDCGDGTQCGRCEAKGQCHTESNTKCGTCRRCAMNAGKGYCTIALRHVDCGTCKKCSSAGACIAQSAQEDLKSECLGEEPCGPVTCNGQGACDFKKTALTLCSPYVQQVRSVDVCRSCNNKGACTAWEPWCTCKDHHGREICLGANFEPTPFTGCVCGYKKDGTCGGTQCEGYP